MPTRTAILHSIDTVYEDYRPRLTVDLGAVRRNAETLHALRPNARMVPVVKADAYGLGAAELVPLLRTQGFNDFFVSYLSEAEDLASVAGDARFYVLNAGPGSGPYTDQLRPVLHRAEDLQSWVGGPCGFQVDIGMHRIGEALSALTGRPPQPSVELVVAHMSDAGDPASRRNEAQRKLFRTLRKKLRDLFPRAAFSLSATGGLLLGGNVEEDAIRPGIGLFGGQAGHLGPLEPVARLEARVLSVFDVPAGDKVGYGGLWEAQTASRCATLSIGYADGLPRSLTGQGVVHLGGKPCPIVGAVSMDLVTIDATGAPGVKPGDWAEIYGRHQSLDTVAARAGLIGYELLTLIRGRTIRVYEDSERNRNTSS